MLKTAIVIALALGAALPAAAQAHVTLQPNTAPAGAYTRLDVRVPNERDDASTTKVEVQFPDGFASASYEPVPGWDVKVAKKTLDTPIQTDDGEITEGVDTITWTADERGRRDPARRLRGLRPLGPDPRQGRRQADLQGAADLHRRRGRALDRRRGLRQSGPDRHRRGGDGGRSRRVAHRRGRGDGHPRRAPERNGRDADRGRLDATRLAIVALIVGALGLIAGTAGLLAARRAKAAA